jgi:hypothetical protein
VSIPRAIWEGTFKLFGVTLRCYVLDDENNTRIINAEDVARLFEKMERGGDTIPLDDYELRRFAMWQRGEL